MIYIDRISVKKPPILESEQVVEEFEKMRIFHLEESEKSKYKRYSFNSRLYTHIEVRESLMKLFHSKCAYCESQISVVDNGDIEIFRPKGGSMSLDGSYDPYHYWWLAYEWDNLYIVCSTCNRRYKRNYFPVKDNIRAPVLGDLSLEIPLLLDPCKETDFFEEQIGFENWEAIALTEKGEITIKTIGLNRDELKAAR